MTPRQQPAIAMGVALLLSLAVRARAQTECQRPIGPDLIVGDITGPSNYNSDPSNGTDALALGDYLCNVGDSWIDWSSNTNRHPVVGAGLFKLRIVNGGPRFEQIGMSWVTHRFFALSNTLCCSGCQSTDGEHLGVRCADPNTSGYNGIQAGCAPRWPINAATGAFTYPPPNPPFSGSTARRLQVHLAELQNSSATVRFFGEILPIVPDDAAAGNDNNNASYREISCSVNTSGNPPMVTSGTFGFIGTTVREQPAIRAWRTIDPVVVESDLQIPNDGLMLLAARATDFSGGQWHYEYALYNMNSDRSGQSFSVPVPAGVSVTNIGFHDVDYHDGDGINNVNRDGTDWSATHAGCRLTWATQSHGENPNGNALRWGTLYNFRFDANAAPLAGGGVATIGLFTPGTPAFVTSDLIPVPGSAGLVGDLNCDGAVNSFDIDPFVLAVSDPAGYSMVYPDCNPSNADLNGDDAVNNFDIDPFVRCLTTGDCGCN